ncbi:MAG TPA: alkaline phosphatase family protein [Gemmatimonadales bacterium]|nr:alkaline phosphatase family protein [Gemmatimonadales bacterium]
MRRCILLLVDGLRPDVAEAELNAGRLPQLSRLVATGGITRAVTAFPSTTSVAYLPFLTGCTPGRCNIPSIRWLDRTRYHGRWWRERDAVRSYCGYQAGRLDSDIADDVRTIFELIPESSAIFTMISRGLTPDRDPAQGARRFWGAVAHYTEWHQPSDRAVSRHLLREVGRDRRFIFAQFPAVDGYTHQSDPAGPRVLRALHEVDRTIGQVLDQLKHRGELDDTLLLVVSDHGAAPVHTHLDLGDWFRRQGIPTMSHPVIWTRSPRAAVMVAGNGSAMVYARPAESRSRRWPLARLRRPDAFGSDRDLIEALLNEPAVALVAAEEEDGSVRVASQAGEAEIWRVGECLSYRPITGDPLGLDGMALGGDAEWLEGTWEHEFPDAAAQLLDQFRASRTGDLVVIAREGYDFRQRFEIPEHRSGHGSLVRSHMMTPLWSNRPVPAERLRTVDLFPAMLNWLGEPVPEGIDGRPIWAPGAAEPAGWAATPAVAESGQSGEFSAPQEEGEEGP